MAKRLHIESWVRLVVLAASFTLGSPASQALESQVLRAGVPGHFPPQYVLDSSGTPSGFAVDVLDAVATEMGFSVRYVVYATWPETLAALERREVDVIPNLGVTPVRERFTLFTLPVETFPISLFVRDIENAVSGVDDLGGRAVSVVKANIGERLIKDQTAAIPVVHSSRGDEIGRAHV